MFKLVVLLVALATVQAHVIAPAYHAGYAAPAIGYAHAPVVAKSAVVAPAYHAGYAAPALGYAHAPVVAKAAVAPGLLGVAYSAAPIVSHMTYSSGLGFNYAW